MESAESKSTPQLIRETFGQVSDILQKEVRLARAEFKEGMGNIKSGLTMTVLGAAFAISGLTVLLGGIAVGLASVMSLWLAAVIIGVASLLIALIVINMGSSRLDPGELEPERTEKTMSANVKLAKEHLS
ncbi:MAG: phage holin family protein [Henriciella sp.]|uniref:phage holin family protein n=1 Tax=Henriciella sp. TaxID=1968823 RepID=UPI003C78874E